MSENLDLFNKFTGEIFATLFVKFPIPQYISFKSFNAELTEDYFYDANSPASKATMDLRSVVEGTFNFLSENGYIIHKISQEGFHDVRLTEKSLVVLNKKPDSLSNDETMGIRIINAVKEGAPSVIAGAITNILTAGLGILTK